MIIHFSDLFGVCFVVLVDQIGIEVCCKVRVHVIFVASFFFITFWPYLHKFCSIGGAFCPDLYEISFHGPI